MILIISAYNAWYITVYLYMILITSDINKQEFFPPSGTDTPRKNMPPLAKGPDPVSKKITFQTPF